MAKAERAVLGIEIGQAELRVVHIRMRGAKLVVSGMGSAPLPMGSVQNGAVRQPGNVAIALTRLMEGHGMNAGRAVIGVASEGCHLRNLAVPPVPDQELSTIVAGEVEHYGLVRSRGGIHSFFPLTPPDKVEEGQPVPVAVFTAEEDIPWGLRDLAERANLDVIALEPLSLSMLRTVVIGHDLDEESVLALVVEEATTDLVFLHKGKVAFYRRIDIGSRSLLKVRDEARMMASVGGETAEQAPEDVARALETLSLETQRSVDYLKRLYKDSADVSKILVCMPSTEVDDLAEAIHDATGLTASSVSIPASLALDSSVANSPTIAIRYTAAVGLALRAFPEFVDSVPTVDLYSKERAAFNFQTKRRNLLGSVLVSCLALALGAVGYVLFSNTAVEAEAQLAANEVKLATVQAQIDELTKGQNLVAERAATMKSTAVPLDRIADAVALSLAEDTGLSELSVEGGGAATMKMQSRTEGAMITTLEKLRASPYFSNVNLGSYQRQDDKIGFDFLVNANSATVNDVEKAGS